MTYIADKSFFPKKSRRYVKTVIETDRNSRKKEHIRRAEENACDQTFSFLSDMPIKHYSKKVIFQ